ncbi:DUF2442 domain-containing protein [Myxococcus stipitatus]|uniref:FHA domain-containing protein n=1 Tax=Myxococcus stipitatus TaxID=83455 RepID=UPI001F264ABD|nr:FHA domain-containing protein [Myxococcus stipitatus]MCE9670143.1 DUF2442 domain-containing protein [Myxococcus stipitatus]
MAAVILEARCVAPFTVRVRFSDGHEGEANLEPCIVEWPPLRTPDLTEPMRAWLREPGNFETVRVDPASGTLAWGDSRPFEASLVYWRVQKSRVALSLLAADGSLVERRVLGGPREVWTRPLTIGRAADNVLVVDREGVEPHHVKVRAGGGHHPCFFIEVVEGTVSAGGTTSSTPGQVWRVPARQALRLELGPWRLEII